MRNWIAPQCKYTVEDGHIKTDGKYREKISGTAMGGLLNLSPYATPFTVSSKLLGVWDEDINDKPAVRVGRDLEERIIDYAAGHYQEVGSFFKAEDIYAKREGKHSDWKSDFEDDVFSGHVDGIVSKDGQDYILEVKTARDASVWVKEVPRHYYWQVCLYNHFITKQDKAYFLLGVVNQETYNNPNSWIANSDNTYLFEVKINQREVAETIAYLRNLYETTIAKGISTQCNYMNDMDMEIMNHLKDISGTMDDLDKLILHYKNVKDSNDSIREKYKKSFDEEEEYKDRIKDVMTAWNLTKAGNVSIRSNTRRSFDFAKADSDGFDYSKYLKETKTNTFVYKE